MKCLTRNRKGKNIKTNITMTKTIYISGPITDITTEGHEPIEELLND